MKKLSLVGLMTILLATIPLYAVQAEAPLPLDYPLPNGHFFRQANGSGGAGDLGFAVTNDDNIPFWDWFQRYGGVADVGYPVSARFLWKDFVVQAFQKVVFQWNSQTGIVAIVNVFDELATAGKDQWLATIRSVPPSVDWASDQGKSWEQIVQNHYALLDQNPAIKQVYLSESDPVTMNGLPMAALDFGNVFVIRAQRKVYQQWRQDTPWAKAGQVTVANGGDVGKEAGLYPADAIAPGMPLDARPLVSAPTVTPPAPVTPTPAAPTPAPFPYRAGQPYGNQNCGLTELRGFIRDASGAGIAGQAVKVTVDGSTWSTVSTLTGGDGQYNVFLDTHPKNGIWNIFVVGPNDAQLSPIIKLETSTDCSPSGGKWQTASVDFTRN